MGGGEGGIRTLDRGLAYTPLAGERLQPLGHLTSYRLSFSVYHVLVRAHLGRVLLRVVAQVVATTCQPFGHLTILLKRR